MFALKDLWPDDGPSVLHLSYGQAFVYRQKDTCKAIHEGGLNSRA